jgi:hypothetical protein
MGSMPSDEGWARATWEGARDAVVREGTRMTLREKLAWLESAHRLAEQIAGNAASEGDAAPPHKDAPR